MNGPPSLIDQVRRLLGSAQEAAAGTPTQERIRGLAARLDEPLRVAIAGKVKAGKSTLLNALVGQALAPTDAGECTRIVTWYRDGVTYRATLIPQEGETVEVPLAHDGGAIRVDLQGRTAADVNRLVIDWPSPSLREMTLIDTPGIASASVDVSQRATDFLLSEDGSPESTDAVLYLMRHLHSTDVSFLEAFSDREVSRATPINAIGILSRADEVGVGKLDSMATAQRIAGRYRQQPSVRRLCQTVLPVAGLLAEAGATLREEEFRGLARIAAAEDRDMAALLLSTDRFLAGSGVIELGQAERESLLGRLGMFGVRASVALIRKKAAPDAGGLAAHLVRMSGLPQVRAVLASQFAARRDVLKARAALASLEALVREGQVPGGLDAEIERIRSGAHEFAEIRLLNALRAGAVGLRPEEAQEAERLLGAEGTAAPARLGLPEGASPEEVRKALDAAMARWQSRAEHPLAKQDAVLAARVLVRTCEGLLSALESAPAVSGPD